MAETLYIYRGSTAEKLQPFVGDLTDSFFMGPWYMYFPFFSGEVKCGAAALDVADRQNAHSMTLAVRGAVELFRLVKGEQELHREILAFAISHDNETRRIYGHYPVIEGKETTFYRHPIDKFSFTRLDGKEKWTAYKFTKSVYDTNTQTDNTTPAEKAAELREDTQKKRKIRRASRIERRTAAGIAYRHGVKG
ncbi:hypothetical protein LTR93_011703 [Exophiala xenobiotica]|nr:hypothetical protein LTR93_011703 [Exophiala xenobiotica]